MKSGFPPGLASINQSYQPTQCDTQSPIYMERGKLQPTLRKVEERESTILNFVSLFVNHDINYLFCLKRRQIAKKKSVMAKLVLWKFPCKSFCETFISHEFLNRALFSSQINKIGEKIWPSMQQIFWIGWDWMVSHVQSSYRYNI